MKIGSFIFQQDNDSKHTAGNISEWFVKNRINTFKWPAPSPDTNPIEHIWDELERRMRPYSPKNKDEFWSIIQKEWQGIDQEVISKLINLMPKRLQESLKNNGRPTRY